MPAPSVSVAVRDGGLGIILAGSGSTFAKIGPAPIGIVNGVYGVGDQITIQKLLGNGGPIPESAALALNIGSQGSVKPAGLLLVVVNPSTYGTISAITHTGPGTGTLTAAAKPAVSFVIKCVTAGSATTSQWQTSVDGGKTFGPTWTAAATIIVPGASFTTLAFGSGAAVVGDLVLIPASATAPSLVSGTGTILPTISSASPVDTYTVIVTITVGGALGTAMFTVTLDGGNTTSQPFLTPGSGVFPISDGADLNAGVGPNKPNGVVCTTGIVITLAGTLTAGDTYSFITTAPSYNSTDLTNAMAALQVDSRWTSGNAIHVVGPAATVSAANTALAALDVLMVTQASANKFNRAMMECPADTDSNIAAAFAAASSLRVGVAAGFENQASPLNGRIQSRSAAWQAMARAGCVSASEALGAVDTGSLPGVVSLGRDEASTPGLYDARFTVLTSIQGRNGFYITGPGRLMAPIGSDFTFWPYGRVMDLLSFFSRQAFLKFLNATVRVKNDGTIDEKDAVKMEQYAQNFINNGVSGLVSSLSVAISRTNNVLSTQTIIPIVRATPFGFALNIPIDLGFANSALTVKAA